tara:strand:- start:150 stop:2333 length:2184 start_codon:yes stop_codon:yes gene_type:complete
MAWAALLKSAGSKAAMQSGKKIATNIAKEAAVDKIKSKFKKKKVKGKDIAKKMLGGGGGESSEKGGALAIRPSSSIVSSPAGGLIPTKKDEGGSLVLSNNSRDLGLTPFMESVIGVKESVKSIKDSLNDNAEDVKKRLEKQRLLNARLRKQEREEELETKKPGLGIGKKLLKPVKDVGVSFLEKLKRFFVNTLLGMFVNALIGGARDVVVAFIFGFKAYKMAKDAVIKFVLNLKGNIGKGLSKAGKGISKVGSSIGKFLGKVRGVLVGWIRNTVKGVQAAIQAAGKSGGKVAQSAGKFLQKTKPLEKVRNFVRNPGKTLQALQKSPVGKTVTNFIKNPGVNTIEGLEGGLKKLQKTQVGKTATNLIKNPGKTLQGGLKTLQKTEAGKGVTNFIKGSSKGPGIFGKIKNFGVKKFNAISSWADNLAKNAMKNVNNIVKGGLEQASKWRKQLGSIAELVKNPMKLLEKAKGILRGKMDKMVQNNNLIKQIKEVAKDPKKIKSFITKLGKNKDVVKTVKTLKKGAKTIKGLDAVLAALMGVIDYTFLGESPINAALRAAGALVGYTAGFAVGAPFGGVPGFFTGIAGSFLGEKAADVIAAGLVHVPTPLGPAGEIVDPIMGAGPKGDGRMIVRNPFSGKGEGERMDNLQEKQAQLGDNKVEDVSQDISESASYEDGAEESTVVIDGGGGDQAPPPISRAGKTKFISLELDKQTILNSNHEANTNAALYKV